MITTVLSLIGPLVLPILAGVVSGGALNIVGAIAGGSRANLATRAIGLAFKVLRGQGDRADAERVIAAADPWMIEKVERDLDLAADAVIPPASPKDPKPDQMRSKSYQRLMKQLRRGEFEIVSSNDLSTDEINQAQSAGRFFVDDDGFGYALVKRQKEQAET